MMRNKYLTKLNKIEFVVSYACTGRCKHCSQGEHDSCGERIDAQISADAVHKIASEYDIKTVMVFGGEPLLYPDTVYAIMSAANEIDIPFRQVITNGYFSNNTDKIREVAERLAAYGVNDLLLSVDALHQETIPLYIVKQFAAEAKRCAIPIRLQPAWLVSREDDNPYNRRTMEILGNFADLELPVGEGNIIFPEGNAPKYLAEYFTDTIPENPYVEDPCDVHCASFSPNGDVLGGNVYESSIAEIMKNYKGE
jgi:pyruvate-formate lyase-activating enzyme